MAIKIMHPIHFVKWIYKKVHSYGIPIPAILASGAAIVSLLFFRHLGGLQRLELVVFDGMVRLGPDNISDSRLLIVELTEEDIQYLGQWPISDKNLADVLASLQKHQPKVIGVDFYRDVPKYPGYTELVEQLQKPNVFGITFIGDRSVSTTPPPPSMPKERIGFNNIPFDPDAVVRRYSLFINNDEETMVAFALHLALAYLQEYEISPQITENNEYQLGDAIFKKLQPNSGGYQQIDAQGYPILINYRNSRSIAPKITIKDVLLGNFDPELVKNKIVIIGNTAPSSNDFSFTPYSYSLKLKMSGVEIHAQATSQIISAVLDDQKLFWYWDESTEILWILSWSIVGGHIAWHIRRPFILLLINILALGVLVAISYGIFIKMGWIPVAAPILGIVMTSGIVIVYKIQASWQQQNMVMKLLGQQTSPEIAQALWQERSYLINSGILPPKTVTATILFTDLKNFSTISEKKTSEALMNWLNEYLSAMTDIVINHHGIVNKFTGDGVMAVFGIPVPRTSVEEIAIDAQNAVNCALAMGQHLSQLNQKWQQQNSPELKMRIGIYTGTVTVGSLGGKNRLEYGVIGDGVNIASRLESFDKERHPGICRVLIAQETLKYLDRKFSVEAWGNLNLKGKKIPVNVYLVTGKNYF
ncbi:MAG: adenylate/guanylate cyclase domain-containing protein [Okeania sp. SIO2G4]|uniref:CHASE2 domain-containing protein n=1 Tax=unclassified Okeania TaxID=2634635 RepID=UPI0013BE032F|nr:MULTISPECIES: adenylate/guanylate cyclase domain-containing protein [unclassified Okeania]NEP38162.1 adenylate/guanylate cyclase domain-containing protein [Okeania sp. SIO2H7]NEP74334.1 adenylate/guanylate cyclase domain-containing protein [Okeania sp. SIO2G5]NEP95410.1 adenylate/guanylate cyclase domain-containing protein [Okeania sp. SIO2F5]NEQ93071.1 adenylate/guanylate cyclase domain-containing protein [Okeania sp. SIO2G4]